MEQVSSVAQREQLEAALDYVREGDTFTVTKLDMARSVGDLLEIVARLEGKKVSQGAVDLRESGTRHLHKRRPLDAQRDRRRGTGRAGGHAGAPTGGGSQGQGAGAATRAVCRPLGGKAGSGGKASAPRKSPASWGLAGPVCIGCWACRRRWPPDQPAAVRYAERYADNGGSFTNLAH
jgi:hypothetical protein